MAACALAVRLLTACGPPAPASGAEETVRPGDLVFTEILADPLGQDAGGEWLELANVSGVALDLGGLVLVSGAREEGPERAAVLPPLPVPADARVVLAAAPGPRVDVVWDAGLGALRNEDGRVALFAGGRLVDEVTWATAPEGRPRALDGARVPDAVLNDAATAWCAPDASGSPGAPNAPCQTLGADGGRCLDGGTLRDVRAPQVGDLVLTEVMADPAAAPDAEGEWFEVLALADVDLNGLTLGPDVAAPVDHVARADCVALPAGAYAVFARRLDPRENGGLARAELPFGFSLTNRGGTLAIGHGGRVLDAVEWSASASGIAHSRSSAAAGGTGAPPETPAEEPVWCDATSLMESGDRGTPGAPNPQCPVPVPEGHCLEGGAAREVRAPRWGDVVVNEVMADPDAVPDSDGEWLELLVRAPVDLNGLAVGPPDGAEATLLEAEQCLAASPGDRLVLARSGAPGRNGGIPRVDAGLATPLVNRSLQLTVGQGAGLVDWADLPEAAPGVALSRDEAGGDWCPAATAYGDGDLGTPGAENPPCG